MRAAALLHTRRRAPLLSPPLSERCRPAELPGAPAVMLGVHRAEVPEPAGMNSSYGCERGPLRPGAPSCCSGVTAFVLDAIAAELAGESSGNGSLTELFWITQKLFAFEMFLVVVLQPVFSE